jgi:hypothetical protein
MVWIGRAERQADAGLHIEIAPDFSRYVRFIRDCGEGVADV